MRKYNFRDMALVDWEQDLNLPEDVEQPINLVNTEHKELLNMIYGLDPVSNLPTGDLSYYQSDKVPMEVRQFIRDNLMTNVSGNATNIDTRGLSDDEIMGLSIQHGESREHYLERISDFVNNTEKYINLSRQNMDSPKNE